MFRTMVGWIGYAATPLGAMFGAPGSSVPEVRQPAAERTSDQSLIESTASLKSLIENLEKSEGIFSESLIQPLTDLATVELHRNNHQSALDAMIRARHIVHRTHGVMSSEQAPMVDFLTELHLAMGKPREANREQRLALRISETSCGNDALCRADGLYKMARWYQRTGRYTRARGQYRKALRILQERFGDSDLSLVPAPHGMARTFDQQGVRYGSARDALERAARILDGQEYTDSQDHVEAHLRLGDWYTLGHDHREARRAYRRAWSLMVADTHEADVADGGFERPVRLRYRPPFPDFGDTAWQRSHPDDDYVVVQFDVNEFGRVENARVIDTNASNRIKRAVRDAVSIARYRPRMEAGQPVATTGLTLRQTFEYVSRYRQARRLSDAVTPNAGRGVTFPHPQAVPTATMTVPAGPSSRN